MFKRQSLNSHTARLVYIMLYVCAICVWAPCGYPSAPGMICFDADSTTNTESPNKCQKIWFPGYYIH